MVKYASPKKKSSSTYNFTILFIYSTPYTPESTVTNFLNQLESAEVTCCKAKVTLT
jgi:hypothetical protein